MARTPRAKEGAEALPSAVRLTSPFSFVEEVHNKGRFDWRTGEIVTNPKTIALLRERGAPIEVVDGSD